MGLGHLRGRGGLAAALNAARAGGIQGRTAEALAALGIGTGAGGIGTGVGGIGTGSDCPTQ